MNDCRKFDNFINGINLKLQEECESSVIQPIIINRMKLILKEMGVKTINNHYFVKDLTIAYNISIKIL